MVGTLKKCKHCDEYGITKMGEAGHTRLYYCPKCGKQTTQYIKKHIKCNHSFEDDMCKTCGYKRREKYV